MSVYQNVAAFLGRNGFPVGGPDINAVIDGLLYDMQLGLDAGSGDHSSGAVFRGSESLKDG